MIPIGITHFAINETDELNFGAIFDATLNEMIASAKCILLIQ